MVQGKLQGNIRGQLYKLVGYKNLFIHKVGNYIPRMMFFIFSFITASSYYAIPANATGIFDIAKSAMNTVYKDIAGISTVAAVVCAAVCLFLMNFSKSGRTVDESRTWLKRIIICWAAIMTMGAIVTYMQTIIPKGDFSG